MVSIAERSFAAGSTSSLIRNSNLTPDAMDINEDTGFKWESSYAEGLALRDAFQTTRGTQRPLSIDEMVQRLMLEAKRKRRLDAHQRQQMDTPQAVRLGILRYLCVAVDMSSAATTAGGSGAVVGAASSRFDAVLDALAAFFERFFELNPLSQLAVLVCRDKRARRVLPFTNSVQAIRADQLKTHMDAAQCSGEFSLGSVLRLTSQHFHGLPAHCSKELLLVTFSLFTVDADPLSHAFETLKMRSIRCSVISLAAEVHVFKRLCQTTGGQHSVALNPQHMDLLLGDHLQPAPLSKQAQRSATAVRMGFPQRRIVSAADGSGAAIFGPVDTENIGNGTTGSDCVSFCCCCQAAFPISGTPSGDAEPASSSAALNRRQELSSSNKTGRAHPTNGEPSGLGTGDGALGTPASQYQNTQHRAFFCPDCGARHCSTPTECRVCGLLLLTAPQLARAHQHLDPLPAFVELLLSPGTQPTNQKRQHQQRQAGNWQPAKSKVGTTTQQYHPQQQQASSSDDDNGMASTGPAAQFAATVPMLSVAGCSRAGNDVAMEDLDIEYRNDEFCFGCGAPLQYGFGEVLDAGDEGGPSSAGATESSVLESPSGAFACQRCATKFCIDCDLLLHDSLQVCPACGPY